MSKSPVRPKTGPAARGADQDVAFLIFDVESVADGKLVAEVHFRDPSMPPDQAVARYRGELAQGQRGSDFIPYTFQVPVAIAVAKVGRSLELLDVKALDEPHYRPTEITRDFWRGWELYREPTLVSFNGRGFDIPLLELAAFRYGVSLGPWMNVDDRAFDQHRNRYNLSAHFDLHDFLTNYGSTRFHGGLALAAHLLGHGGRQAKPGTLIQDLHARGEIEPIVGFAKQDVLDTYFVFLRTSVLMGRITGDEERRLTDAARTWIEDRAANDPVMASYLDRWRTDETAEAKTPAGRPARGRAKAVDPDTDANTADDEAETRTASRPARKPPSGPDQPARPGKPTRSTMRTATATGPATPPARPETRRNRTGA